MMMVLMVRMIWMKLLTRPMLMLVMTIRMQSGNAATRSDHASDEDDDDVYKR